MQYVYPFVMNSTSETCKASYAHLLAPAAAPAPGTFLFRVQYLSPSLLPTATNANANVTLSTEQSSNRSSILTDRLSSCLFACSDN